MDPKTDRIIQVGAIRLEDGKVAGSFSSFVHTPRAVPVRIKRLTGISDADTRNAPPTRTVLQQLLSFIGGDFVVAHNAGFEQSFLEAEASRHGIALPELAYVDTVELARLACPDMHGHRLDALAQALGIPLPKHHDAMSDAETCGRLYAELCRMLGELGRDTVEIVLSVADEQWPLRPHVLSALASSGQRPFRPGVRLPGELEPLRASGALLPLDPVELARLLSVDGPLSSVFENYEYRHEQVQLLALVADAFNDGRHLLAEAGTGIGKSLAYLIPAARWAMDNSERVVVSTHTINLQEQLVRKDIPLLRAALGWDFQVGLLKGRTNYVCLRRYFDLVRSGVLAMDPTERRTLARLTAWLSRTQTGDRGEISLYGPGEAVFGRICAEVGACAASRCPYRDRCFVNAARKLAGASHIVIANHSLVFSDIAAKNKVLPQYSHIVFDEAHHLEDAATDHLGVNIRVAELFRIANEWTLPNPYAARVQRLPLSAEERAPLVDLLEQVSHRAKDSSRAIDDLAALLLGVLRLSAGGESSGRLCQRLVPGLLTDAECAALRTCAADAAQTLRRLAAELAAFSDLGTDDTMPDELLDICQQASFAAVSVEEFAAGTGTVLSEDGPGTVRWLEGDSAVPASLSLRAAPVDVSELLKDRVFETLRSVVMTSATLAVEGRFDYIKERLGLSGYAPARLIEEIIGSPFDFPRQALLCIPNDMPSVQKTPSPDMSRRITDFLYEVVSSIGGRTLVLFTSHRMLQEVYYALKPRSEAIDICVLAQGIDGGRTRLIEELRSSDRTVVLGSNSFWEGVDVPGNSLSCVVMVRLPFWPPTMPVVQARQENLERSGRSAFFGMSLPEAVIRFKQGFGRLVRTRTDKGAVIVIDQRLAPSGSNYGAKFLKSLPGPKMFIGSAVEIVDQVCEWLGDVPE